MSPMAQLSFPHVPVAVNEPMVRLLTQRTYAPGSVDREKLKAAIKELEDSFPVKVPLVINGQRTFGEQGKQVNPSNHAQVVCTFPLVTQQQLTAAIDGALEVRDNWESMTFADRAAIFLRAASLLASEYRYKVLAATMLGQGKNVWQAEIDAACELIDFWRFNCEFAAKMYSEQPKSTGDTWNRVEYRALEGFVFGVSPFNFTAIGGNIVSAPALMGNVVVWKPSLKAVLSNYIIYQILEHAGLPRGVVQFVPGSDDIVNDVLKSPMLAGLHFTGSTSVFQMLWKQIGNNIEKFKSIPRIVGETGGKNFHFVHSSADLKNAVLCTIRGAFEYQGQKCSACSRLYVPVSIWPDFERELVSQAKRIKVGPVTDFSNFMTPVIDRVAYDRILSFIENSKAKIVYGGKSNDVTGYFIHPHILQTTDPKHHIMSTEVFGPVLSVFVYEDLKFEETLLIASMTSEYALTGAIFANDRSAVSLADKILRHSAGNFYINDKCTGAVVGQQPFGGARASGTNDKAGAQANLQRWTSMRTIKETFVPIHDFIYPSNHQVMQ